jgi:hypothetical protein
MPLQFIQQNRGWNAEPNVPEPTIQRVGNDISLRFFLNFMKFKNFKEDEQGILRFKACSRYRLGPTNDEGWFHGQCRYSKKAPEWGEFYELIGDDADQDLPADWKPISLGDTTGRHFLFYFRDETFECFADDWSFEAGQENALLRLTLPKGTEKQSGVD